MPLYPGNFFAKISKAKRLNPKKTVSPLNKADIYMIQENIPLVKRRIRQFTMYFFSIVTMFFKNMQQEAFSLGETLPALIISRDLQYPETAPVNAARYRADRRSLCRN